jgi:hypothetical protein
MKKRISRVLNFFAFNLLFFALYLNFIHKDTNVQTIPVAKPVVAATTKGTVLVTNPEQYLNKVRSKNEAVQTAQLEN